MTRRQAAAAVAAGVAAGATPGAGAAEPGFHMPDEGEPHACTWMGFAASHSLWGDDLAAVQQDLMRIADAIAGFEPVNMLVNAHAAAQAQALRDAAAHKARIRLVPARLDDLWLRDTGPVFVQHRGSRALRAVDFNFNGWGGKQAHGRDAQVAGFIARQAGAEARKSRLVLEGGALEVDGQGTAIVKESCVLNPNRNPGLGKAAVAQVLRDTLGLQQLIWLPGPAGGDITDAHTDFYARFAGAGRVVVSHDVHDTYGEQAVTQAHIEVLRQARDAAGRRLSLTIVPVPEAPAAAQAHSDSFAAGYINYYLCNGALVLPAFGDRQADRAAHRALQALYPTRQLVPMRTDAIAAGGGGIHCTTQQQPA